MSTGPLVLDLAKKPRENPLGLSAGTSVGRTPARRLLPLPGSCSSLKHPTMRNFSILVASKHLNNGTCKWKEIGQKTEGQNKIKRPGKESWSDRRGLGNELDHLCSAMQFFLNYKNTTFLSLCLCLDLNFTQETILPSQSRKRPAPSGIVSLWTAVSRWELAF